MAAPVPGDTLSPFMSDISVTPSKATITFDVNNTATESWTGVVAFTVDGALRTSTRLTVPAGEMKESTVSFNHGAAEGSQINIGIGFGRSMRDSNFRRATVPTTPPTPDRSSLRSTKSPNLASREPGVIEVGARVENVVESGNGETVTEQLQVTVDGQPVDGPDVTLGPRERDTIRFSIEGVEGGTREVCVGF